MAKTFENGFAQGKTEASLEGIAKSQDAIFEWLHGLPCEARWGYISSLRAGQKYLWALMFLLVGAIGGLALQAIFG